MAERSRLSRILPNFRFLPPIQRPKITELSHLWNYNCYLLTQSVGFIKRIQNEASSRFRYGQTCGAHIRHIIDHYSALCDTLTGTSFSVCYDKRHKDAAIQNFPDMATAKIQTIIATFLEEDRSSKWRLNSPLCTTQLAGAQGELEITVETTLGRELMQLAHHTIHHHALLAHIAQEAGVSVEENFGKSPSTLAFNRMMPSS
jgi:uncharacterized damage-inducible protein DinB